MTSTSHAALILGGSGRTGSLVARHLAGHSIPARTASRHGSEVFFDWDDPATYPDALAGTDRVYLVTPGRPPASFGAFARRNAAAWTTPEDK